MDKGDLKTILVAGLFFLATSQAFASNFSFTGTFAQDDDVQVFDFTADGASEVTLRSYSYAGGTQADGNVVPGGGFDPILALFDSMGVLIAQQDDDPDDNGVCDGSSDPNTGRCFDTFFTQLLAAGDYRVAIAQYNNFANGPDFSDGFSRQGEGNFTAGLGCSNGSFCDTNANNRTNAWAFDILNAGQATQVSVPEPVSLLLMGSGLLGIVVLRKKREE